MGKWSLEEFSSSQKEITLLMWHLDASTSGVPANGQCLGRQNMQSTSASK